MSGKINLLADALYYTRADSGASVEKAQGVVIGLVSAIMGLQGVHFLDAIEIVKEYMPASFRLDAIPEAWRDCFTMEG